MYNKYPGLGTIHVVVSTLAARLANCIACLLITVDQYPYMANISHGALGWAKHRLCVARFKLLGSQLLERQGVFVIGQGNFYISGAFPLGKYRLVLIK